MNLKAEKLVSGEKFINIVIHLPLRNSNLERFLGLGMRANDGDKVIFGSIFRILTLAGIILKVVQCEREFAFRRHYCSLQGVR